MNVSHSVGKTMFRLKIECYSWYFNRNGHKLLTIIKTINFVYTCFLLAVPLWHCGKNSLDFVLPHAFCQLGLNTFLFSDIFIRELFWIVVRGFFLCLTKSGTQENSLSGSLMPSLENMEYEARSKVRPKLIEHISRFVRFLPSQFNTGY